MEDTQLKPVIDLHTHLFNSRYIPLAAFIKARCKIVPRPVANALQNLLHNSTGTCDSLDDIEKRGIEIRKKGGEDIDEKDSVLLFGALCSGLYQRYKAGLEAGDIDEDNEENEKIIEALELIRRYAENNFKYVEEDLVMPEYKTFGELFGIEYELDEVGFAGKLEGRYEVSFVKFFRWLSKWGRKILKIPRTAKFIFIMLKSECELYQELKEDYQRSDYLGEAGIDLCVHHMMDMEKAYKFSWCINGKPRYEFYTKQIDELGKLVQMSEGRLVGFTAFDPRRPRKWKKILEYALKKGNRGVKFYPPMGYRAAENEKEEIQTCVDAFFEFCANPANDVPVFTHCTPVGVEAYKCWGINADPKYWRVALEKHRKLTLCLGHAGGGGGVKLKCEKGKKKWRKKIYYPGWFDNDDDWKSPYCYARKVVELCEDFENVYCEIAYMAELLDNKEATDDIFIPRLKRLLLEGTGRSQAKYMFSDKIMYGSDWHMADMLGRTYKYLDKFKEIFNEIFNEDAKLKGYAGRFFYLNSLRYLKLDKYISYHKQHNPDFLTEAAKTHLYELDKLTK